MSHYTTKTPPNPQLNRLSGRVGLFIHRPAKGVPFRRLSSSVLTTPQTATPNFQKATPNSRRQNVAVCAHPLFTAPLRVVKIPDGKNNGQTAIQTAKFCRLRSDLIFWGSQGFLSPDGKGGRSHRGPKGTPKFQTAKRCRLRSALIYCTSQGGQNSRRQK